jgi:hypothetical protein
MNNVVTLIPFIISESVGGSFENIQHDQEMVMFSADSIVHNFTLLNDVHSL